MKNLVLKDIKLLGSINILLFSVASMGGFLGKIVDDRSLSVLVYFFAAFISVYLLAMRVSFNDSRWYTDQLLASLPIKRFNIVISRYISIFIYVFLLLGVELIISRSTSGLIPYMSGFDLSISAMTFIASILFLFLSINIPLQYLDPRKTQIANSIMYMFIILAPLIIRKMNIDWSKTRFRNIVNLDFKFLAPRLLAISLLIYVGSLFASKIIYRRKEF